MFTDIKTSILRYFCSFMNVVWLLDPACRHQLIPKPWQRKCSCHWVGGEYDGLRRRRVHVVLCTSRRDWWCCGLFETNPIDWSRCYLTIDPWQRCTADHVTLTRNRGPCERTDNAGDILTTAQGAVAASIRLLTCLEGPGASWSWRLKWPHSNQSDTWKYASPYILLVEMGRKYKKCFQPSALLNSHCWACLFGGNGLRNYITIMCG